jgi:hypothetical protein
VDPLTSALVTLLLRQVILLIVRLREGATLSMVGNWLMGHCHQLSVGCCQYLLCHCHYLRFIRTFGETGLLERLFTHRAARESR